MVVDFTSIYFPQHQQEEKQKAAAHYDPHEHSLSLSTKHNEGFSNNINWGFSNSNTTMQLIIKKYPESIDVGEEN